MTGDFGPARLWDGLLAAARGEPTSAAARAAVALSVDEGRPRLGWVIPASWAELERKLAATGFTVPTAGGLLITTTGGWAFSASAAAQTADPGHRLSVADTLDARCLARHLTAASCLAISASGRTYETRLLAEVISVAWRSRASSPHWLSEATVPGGLSVRPGAAVTAVLGAPLSVPFALACAATGVERFLGAYAFFLQAAPETGRRMAELACAVPIGSATLASLDIVLPAWAGDGVRMWALQALRQGLGGKQGRVVWCDVSHEGRPAGVETGRTRIRLAEALAHGTGASLAGAMIVMYAIAVLTACLGIRCGIPFASHPAVARYKALLHAGARCAELTVGSGEVTAAAARWLAARPELTGAHLVVYGPQDLQPGAGTLGPAWEVHVGSRWNHHSYQAVQADRRLGLVAVAATQPPAVLTGDDVLDAALRGLHARQLAIARATCASLADRALLILVVSSRPA
ncbi:MAG TPA: hypothetical protein VMC03_03350 [Streptosporangiaceae bacterium]|nr:hypothetical protein [Streptosporangiaceae bacterium]